MPQGDRTPHSGKEEIIPQTAMPIFACNDEVLQDKFSEGVVDKIDVITQPFFSRPKKRLSTDFSQNAVYGVYSVHMLKYCIAHYNSWVDKHGPPTSDLKPPAKLAMFMKTMKIETPRTEDNIGVLRALLDEEFKTRTDRYFKARDILNTIKTKNEKLYNELGLADGDHNPLKAAMTRALGGNHFKTSGLLDPADQKSKISSCFKNWYPKDPRSQPESCNQEKL
jgi:hypothetical protein